MIIKLPKIRISYRHGKKKKTQTRVTKSAFLISILLVSSLAGVIRISPVNAAISQEQSAMGTATNGQPSATFGSTPAVGNLLVAVASHRTSSHTPSISGSGWSSAILTETLITNSSARRATVWFWKVAGSSEPTSVTITWASCSCDSNIHIREFSGTGAGAWNFEDSSNADNGTTAGTSQGSGSANTINPDAVAVVAHTFRHGDVDGEVSYNNSYTGLLDNSSGSGANELTTSSAYLTSDSMTSSSSTASWTTSSLSTGTIVMFSHGTGDKPLLTQEGYIFENDDCSGRAAFSIGDVTKESEGGSSTLTIDRPAQIDAGDLMIAVHSTDYQASEPTLTEPADWTEVGNVWGSTGGTKIAVYYKVALDGEEDTYDFSTSAGNNHQATIFEVRGVNSRNPINASQFTADETFDSNLIAPSVTPTIENGIKLTGVKSPDGQDIDYPSGVSAVGDHDGSGDPMNQAIGFEILTSSAATGDDTFTHSSSTVRSTGFQIVLNPSIQNCDTYNQISVIGTPLVDQHTNGGDITLTFNGDVQEDDVVLLVGGGGTTSAGSGWGPVTSGYTELAFEDWTVDEDLALGAWYKVMGSTPDTNVIGEGASVTEGSAYGAYVLRGVDTSNVEDAVEVLSSGTSSTPDLSSISTNTSGAMVFAIAAKAGISSFVSAPSDFGGVIWSDVVDTNRYGLASSYAYAPSGETVDPGTYAWNTTTDWKGFTIAIKPDTSAGLVSALAGSEFSSGKTLDEVRVGERFNLSAQITNSGGSSYDELEYGLFYDRNDGIWSRVQDNSPLTNTTGDCDTDTNFSCETIGVTGDLGYYIDMAIHPLTGAPWVAFRHNNSDYSLWVAEYVGQGGNCDTTHAGSDAWACTEIDDSGSTGQYPSIAFDNYGKAWVSYHDSSNGNLEVAEYVGSGGNCDSTRSGSDAWNCTTVDATDTVGVFTALIIDNDGDPWVGYLDDTNDDYGVAEYVGSGGNCDSVGGGSDAWECTNVMVTGLYRFSSGITIDGDGDVWVVSYNDSTEVEVAEYVGSGGDCDTLSGGSDAWECTIVDSSDNVGQSADMTTDPEGHPWVIYTDLTTDDINVAEYVGSGGNCDSVGSGSDAWECTVVDATDDLDGGTSIGFDASGTAWITYRDSTNSSLESARYVGSGGNCDSVGSGSDAWECSRIDNSGAIDSDTSVEFGYDGQVYVAFSDGDQKFAALDTRGGEILASYSNFYSDDIVRSESHSDMGSATDTTDRDDPDCLAGSTTWNDGFYSSNSVMSGVTLDNGTTTQQCTELTWTIDTSNAIPGETYRFIVATKDSFLPGENLWRGPIAVATDGYPEITMVDDFDSEYVYSKASLWVPDTDCNDDANWGCVEITDDDAGSALGYYNNIAFAPDGTMWYATYDNDSSYRDLRVGRYVGEGGSSSSDCRGNNSEFFECWDVETTGQVGDHNEIAFAPDGQPYVIYNGSGLDIAKYVGSGGNCDDPAWDCKPIDTSNNAGGNADIAFTSAGKAVAVYLAQSTSDLMIAREVDGGGTGCDGGVTDWTCEKIEDITSPASGGYSIEIDQEDKIWVAYDEDGSEDDLWVAEYVGSGGSGCTNPAWTCTEIHTAFGSRLDMALDSDGDPWIVFQYQFNDIIVAEYVGSGGTGCAVAAWDCTTIDGTQGDDPSIAIDSEGNPWVSYADGSNDELYAARFVGSGGNCDDTLSGSDEWECMTLDLDTTSGQYNDLAFDHAGRPWIISRDGTTDVGLAVMYEPPTPLGTDILGSAGTRNAIRGHLPYTLSPGISPYTDSLGTCNSVIDVHGYCGLFTPDGQSDSLEALAGQRPTYAFSQKYDNNSIVPTAKVSFTTSVSPATQNVLLQIYRYGTTDAWETLETYSTAGCTGTDPCVIVADATGTTSEYFRADGGDYWVDFRLYQVEDPDNRTTLYLDRFQASQTQNYFRYGRTFRENQTDPLRW